jgi:curved DNA-binding protein
MAVELFQALEAMVVDGDDHVARAAYDEVAQRHQRGQDFQPPPGWDTGYEFSGRGHSPEFGPEDGGMDLSDFFESLFGHGARSARGSRGAARRGPMQAAGGDHHAKILIDLEDAYRGARRTISLRVPVTDAQGRTTLQERQLDVNIPKGVREGQHLRLAGQGGTGFGGGPAGDLYLEIGFQPHAHFRVVSKDVYLDLPVTPWEAALGATVTAPTPDGQVQLDIPSGSASGRKLRLKGKGLPGHPPGDMYVVLDTVAPPADTEAAKQAYAALARAFPRFNPRAAWEA